MANEYGYQGKEIAVYLHKDPALITRHLKERKDLKGETEKVIKTLKNVRSNVNSQA